MNRHALYSAALTAAFCLSAFTTHLVLGMQYSNPAVPFDSIFVILDPVRDLFITGPTLTRESVQYYSGLIQINAYTGNPFFLYPVFRLVGLSPFILRMLLIGFMAGTTVIAFFWYRIIFGTGKAIIGVLLLLNLPMWLLFRYHDFTYAAFFSTICVLLYAVWLQRNDVRVFYLLSFFTGLFFYFKALIAYTVIGLVIATLLTRRPIRDRLTPRQIGYGGLLLLLGMTPFWIFTYFNAQHDFWLFHLLALEGFYIDNAAKSITLSEILHHRLENLSFLLSRESFPGLNWDTALRFTGIGAAAGVGLVASLYRRRHLPYVAAAATTFLLLLYVPRGADFRQTIILIPFVPVFLITLYEATPLDNARVETVVILGLSLLLLSTIVSFEAKYEAAYDGGPEPLVGAEEHYLMEIDGGTQDWYTAFETLDVSGVLATNAYNPYVSSKYDLDVKKTYFLHPPYSENAPDNWSTASRVKKHIVRFFSSTPGTFRPDRRVTLLLQQTLECGPDRTFCGSAADDVIQQFGIDADHIEYVSLQGRNYTLARNVTIS